MGDGLIGASIWRPKRLVLVFHHLRRLLDTLLSDPHIRRGAIISA